MFGRTIHYRDVVQIVLQALAAAAMRQLEQGVRLARDIPADDGARRTAAFLDTLDHADIERKVSHLFTRSASHLARAGLDRFFEAKWERAWDLEETRT